MQCLIIAAGQGTRLRTLAASKPLAQLNGRPLLEHIAHSAKAGGATSFLVVTGYEAEGIEALLPALAERVGTPMEAVRNPDWHRPNGLSVLAAAPRLEAQFALLMSDHLFDPNILRALIAGRREGAALMLAADYAIANPLLDLDDATKLQVDSAGRIAAIGKALTDYNAVDTGIFLGTTALLDAIQAAVEAGGAGSLSEGVAKLSEAGTAFAFDIEGRWWLDVDDEIAWRKAQDALPATA
jgi:choline kinase